MATTEQQIDSFAQFAKERLANGGDQASIDDLFDEWRLLHPPQDDALAVQASLRDMQQGETGKPFAQFADEFRARHDIPDAE